MKSPCVRICRLDADLHCTGCGRTSREIRLWSSYDDSTRDAVMARLAAAGFPKEPSGWDAA
ncbi:MAG: DUF1289 domain-containing protein [Alphaproteobacteria bacterium]|nr:DUF1289 domain-containing protein [Alphaproteobacteria bacterium]MCA0449538.1 DUF1289 domain-containing protein [Pseudomonadota bacterium]